MAWRAVCVCVYFVCLAVVCVTSILLLRLLLTVCVCVCVAVGRIMVGGRCLGVGVGWWLGEMCVCGARVVDCSLTK